MKLLIATLGVLFATPSFAAIEMHHSCTDDQTVTVSWTVRPKDNEVRNLSVRSIGGNKDISLAGAVSSFNANGSILFVDTSEDSIKVNATKLSRDDGDMQTFTGTLDINVKLPNMQLKMDARKVYCTTFGDA